MKKLKYIIAVIVLIITSCTTEGRKVEDKSTSRIKVKENRVIDGRIIVIFEIDSVEYLGNLSEGGFVKLK